MEVFKNFKKLKRTEQMNLIQTYYKDKNFRDLLKKNGLNELGKVLNSIGSGNFKCIF